MNRTKYVISLLLIGMMLLGYVGRVQAVRDLPSSFYGEIQYMETDTKPSTGTMLDAYVTDVPLPVASSAITNTAGVVTYAINVIADDTDTLDKDGGVAGDTVTFKIGERIVATADWVSGPNVKLDFHPPAITEVFDDPILISKNNTPTEFSLTLSVTDAVIEDTFTWSIATPPIHGFASLPSVVTGTTMEIYYDPAVGYVGPDPDDPLIPDDSFSVKVTDHLQGGEDIVTVNVEITDTVTLTVLLDGFGTVTSNETSPRINCPGTCSATYDPNTTVYLTANAGTGSHFVQWTGDDSYISDLNPVSIFMDKDWNLTAHFLLDKLTISGNAGVEGVLITYDGGTTTTNEIGDYSFTVDYGWTGTVTPSLTGYVFDPANRAYNTPIAADQTLQNFTATQIVHSIPLSVGWNLVSFNVVPLDSDTADILADLNTNYDLVYAWNATADISAEPPENPWLKYDRTATSGNTLLTLDVAQGFWIRMTAADTLDVYGSAYPTSTAITLNTEAGGWNLVGFPAHNNLAMPGALDSNGLGPDTARKYTLVYGYRATDTTDPWELYDPAAPAYVNDMSQLEPGMGYWIKVTETATWTVPY